MMTALLNPQAHGLITGYASLFGVADKARDIVERGAFSASLRQKNASAIRMLWQHDPHKPIGVWTSLTEDAIGLKVTGRLALETQQGREAAALITSGALDGLSIGFKAVKARPDRATGCRHLLEVELWEVSLVTFPALSRARIERVRHDSLPLRLRDAAIKLSA